MKYVDMISREVPIPPIVTKAVKSGYDRFSCRRCGYGLENGDHKRRLLYTTGDSGVEPQWEYCPNCGQKIMHGSFAGCCGWTKETADSEWREIQRKVIEGLEDGSYHRILYADDLIECSRMSGSWTFAQMVMNLVNRLFRGDDMSDVDAVALSSESVSDICRAMARKNEDES